MTNVLLIGDVHLTERPPRSCTETYLDDLFDLLEQCRVLAQGVEQTIFTGDLFHHKGPSRTSHSLVQRCMDLFRRWPHEPWVVPGNHDMQHDRAESVLETQPLGVLAKSGHVLPFTDTIYDDMVQITPLPWQQDWNKANWGELAQAHLIVAHAPIYPPGQDPPYECIPAEIFADKLRLEYASEKAIYYGHVHNDHDQYLVKGFRFGNFGALTRGSIAEHDVNRRICVAKWNSRNPMVFERVYLNAKPPEEVLRMADAEAEQEERLRLDGWLELVRNGAGSTGLVTPEEYIRSRTDLPETIRELCVQLLEAAQ